MAQYSGSDLAEEQKSYLARSKEGHNFLIQGKAGTGKSFVVCKMADCLRKFGKNVQLVAKWLTCFPITVHSFLGVGTASAPLSTVIQNATKRDVVKAALSEVDTVIWDECSMGSSRLLEMFHRIACVCRKSSEPFGGCQVGIYAYFSFII